MKPRKYRAKTIPKLLGVVDGVQQYTKSEWVYGYYAPTYLAEIDGEIKNIYCIISDDTIGGQEMLGCGHYTGLPKAYRIIEETVSQSIGLFDKNGKEIFEGDIVKFTWEAMIDGKTIINTEKNIVEYKKVHHKDGDGNPIDYIDFCVGNVSLLSYISNIEVIGNIWDNPELLEEKYERDTI